MRGGITYIVSGQLPNVEGRREAPHLGGVSGDCPHPPPPSEGLGQGRWKGRWPAQPQEWRGDTQNTGTALLHLALPRWAEPPPVWLPAQGENLRGLRETLAANARTERAGLPSMIHVLRRFPKPAQTCRHVPQTCPVLRPCAKPDSCLPQVL